MSDVSVLVRYRITREKQLAEAVGGRSARAERSVRFGDSGVERWAELVKAAELSDNGSLSVQIETPLTELVETLDDVFAGLAIDAVNREQCRARERAAREEQVAADARSWLEQPAVEPYLDLPEVRTFVVAMAARGANWVGGERAAREAVMRAARLDAARAWLATLDDSFRVLPEVLALEGVVAEGDPDTDDRRRARTAGWTLPEHTQAERAVRAAEADAQAEREQDEAEAWIAEHGSPRLRRIVASGMLGSSTGVFRDERLAVERPGWEWADRNKNADAINPSTEALDLLDEARKVDSESRLVFRQGEHAVVASYLGSEIVLWLPASERRPKEQEAAT